MDAIEAEKLLDKANSILVFDDDPAIIFIFDELDKAQDAFNALIQVFGDDDLNVYIRYNKDFIRLYITSEKTSEFIISKNKPFQSPLQYQRIKPISSIFNGTDINGRKFNKPFQIFLGKEYEGGAILAKRDDLESGLGKIVKFGTQLVPE